MRLVWWTRELIFKFEIKVVFVLPVHSFVQISAIRQFSHMWKLVNKCLVHLKQTNTAFMVGPITVGFSLIMISPCFRFLAATRYLQNRRQVSTI